MSARFTCRPLLRDSEITMLQRQKVAKIFSSFLTLLLLLACQLAAVRSAGRAHLQAMGSMIAASPWWRLGSVAGVALAVAEEMSTCMQKMAKLHAIKETLGMLDLDGEIENLRIYQDGCRDDIASMKEDLLEVIVTVLISMQMRQILASACMIISVLSVSLESWAVPYAATIVVLSIQKTRDSFPQAASVLILAVPVLGMVQAMLTPRPSPMKRSGTSCMNERSTRTAMPPGSSQQAAALPPAALRPFRKMNRTHVKKFLQAGGTLEEVAAVEGVQLSKLIAWMQQ